MNQKQTKRERRIYALALSISQIMRSHPDRTEAIDAYDVARILFRKGSNDHPVPDQLSPV